MHAVGTLRPHPEVPAVVHPMAVPEFTVSLPLPAGGEPHPQGVVWMGFGWTQP